MKSRNVFEMLVSILSRVLLAKSTAMMILDTYILPLKIDCLNELLNMSKSNLGSWERRFFFYY